MFWSRIRFRAAAILGLGLILLATPFVPAQNPHPKEYELKAAILFKFANFVEWPTEVLPHDKSPFVIGILGDNPFGSDLEAVTRGKMVNDHPIEIRKDFSSA